MFILYKLILFTYLGIGTTTVTVTATASNSDLYKDVTETFDVTVNAAEKSENVIAFDFDSYSTVYGTNLEGLVSGSTGFDGEITATSSNPSVLTVAIDAEGNVTVTPVAVGSATVTFSAAETTSFLAAEDVQQVFTVTAPVGSTIAPVSGEVTYTFDFIDNTDWEFPTATTAGENTYTNDGKTITLYAPDNGYKHLGSVLLIGKNGATLTLPAFDKPVTKITTTGVPGSSSKVTQNIFVGETAVSTGTTNAQNDHEYVIAPEYQAPGTIYTFKVTNANNTQLSDFTVHMYQAPTTTVTLNKNGYATFCSENPVDFTTTEGYTAWRVNEVASDGTITFKKVTETIKGGQGVLLYNKDADGENTSDVTISFADGTIIFDNGTDGDYENDNLLFGTTAPTYIPANEYYGLSGNKFVKVNAGTVPAGKALLPATAIPAGARELKLVFEDENTTTGIRTIENAEMRTENAVYDLQGRKVTKPVKGGLYIENGLKFVKK